MQQAPEVIGAAGAVNRGRHEPAPEFHGRAFAFALAIPRASFARSPLGNAVRCRLTSYGCGCASPRHASHRSLRGVRGVGARGNRRATGCGVAACQAVPGSSSRCRGGPLPVRWRRARLRRTCGSRRTPEPLRPLSRGSGRSSRGTPRSQPSTASWWSGADWPPRRRSSSSSCC